MDISIKLDGCKLFPADHVKYLGLNLDKFLNWDYHIKLLRNKLGRANGVLCKLRQYAPNIHMSCMDINQQNEH